MKKLKYLALGICSLLSSMTCHANSTILSITLYSASEVSVFCSTNNCISVIERIGGAYFLVTYDNGGEGPIGSDDNG